MPQDFTITKVSSNPPTPWKNGISYYKVMLEGVPTAQEIGKKSVPMVGQTVYGDIIDGKFKRADKEFTSNDGFGGSTPPGSPKPAYQPKDEAAIQAMWSIGQGVAWVTNFISPNKEPQEHMQAIEGAAGMFFAMVDRIKAGDSVSGPGVHAANSNWDNQSAIPTPEQQPAPDLPPVENYDNVPFDVDDPVDLDSIPF